MNEQSSNSRLLRVLIVEDSPPDAQLLVRALQKGGYHVKHQQVATAEAMTHALESKSWDLVLADHAMPRFDSASALRVLKQSGLDVPFIIVSGHIDEDAAVAAMREGAHDYIMKERLARLVPAVERELREAETRRAWKKSEEELRQAREDLEARVERRTAALKTANEQLQKSLEDRRRLESELLEIAENERRRIGFDLHDDLGQKLTGLSMMIKGIEHKLEAAGHPCASDAAKALSLIEQITAHTHKLAHDFSSLDAQGEDLQAVLKSLVANVKKMFCVSCTLALKGALPELPSHAVAQLYKICQEAVSNSIKHGKAKEVSIQLTRHPEAVVLNIINDGLPFSPDGVAKNRMGLKIMHYRASTLGAELEIAPLKTGTMVTVKIPVTEELPNLPDPVRPTNRHKASRPALTASEKRPGQRTPAASLQPH